MTTGDRGSLLIRAWLDLARLRLPANEERIDASVASVIYLALMPLYLLILRPLSLAPRWPISSAALGSALVLGSLFVVRSSLARQALFLLNVFIIAISLSAFYPYLALAMPAWFPFQASKLLALIVGFLAPGLIVGLLAVLVAVGLPIFQFLHFPGEIQSRLTLVEPWGLIGFGGAAIILLIHRLRLRQIEMHRRELELEAESTRRLGEALLEIRDLMNTPLQTIKIATHLLRRKPLDSESRAILERQESACARLKVLSERLARATAVKNPS